MAPLNDPSKDVPDDMPDPGPLAGKHIVVALTGGIACYKVATVVSRLVQLDADVRVLMTEAATHFVGPATFQALSGKPVLTSIWQADDHPDSQHVGVARWADLMLIAPATADIIAKLTHGLTDDVVSLTACALPQETPLMLAPSMNADMWDNPILEKNLATLAAIDHIRFIGPDSGWQACRTEGTGRMSEPEVIVETVVKQLAANKH